MDIRDAGFWKNLAPIFSIEPDEPDSRGRGRPGARFCEEDLLPDRFRQAIIRARRNHHHVLLLLLQLDDGDNSPVLQKTDAARVTELALRRLGRCLRSVDTLCRRGDRQIVVLLEELRESTPVPLVVEKIHSVLQYPFSFGELDIRLLPTAGASLFPSDGDEAAQLWLQAKLALDRAHREAPGSYRFSPVVAGQVAMERFELSKDLYRAYRNSEFTVAYQPVLSIDGKTLRGLEVLSRWQHPLRGELQPHEFLHLLEESGLIAPVGEQIVSAACQFMKTLRDVDYGSVRPCMNISARQLADPGFLLAILDALYDADIRPQWLQLEFPLSLFRHYAETVPPRTLSKLKEAGIRIATDQYAGDSIALADLESLHVSLLKTERGLISRIQADPALREKTAVTLEQARRMDIECCVTGIETAAQLQLSAELGFSEAQGTFFAPPLDEAGLKLWLSA